MEKAHCHTTAPATTGHSSCHIASQASGGWFRRHCGLIFGGGAIAVVVALGLSQHWIAAAALTPLLFLLPCTLMMFMCMKGMHHDHQKAEPQPPDTRNQPVNTSGVPK